MFSRSLKAAFLYFGLVFGAGFILGSIRVPFLVPRLGVRWAELIEMPVMLLVVVLAARTVIDRLAVPVAPGVRLSMGVLALAFLVAAELLLVVTLQGQSVRDYMAGRDLVSGSVYLGMLIFFALMPQILGIARRPRSFRLDTQAERTVQLNHAQDRTQRRRGSP